MQSRLDGKLILLYTLLVLQVFIVMIYVISTPTSEYDGSTTRNPVPIYNQIKQTPKPTTRTINGEIKLRDTRTSEFFIIKNETGCWKEGLDEDKMKTVGRELDRCICKQGWHGADCGEPEVVWRAIMASKQNIKLTRRRTSRRLIYVFSVHDFNSAIAEVIVEELYRVVDLFVICDFSNSEENFKHKLAKGLLEPQQNKILYINAAGKARKPMRVISRFIWEKISVQVKNIKHDDIYVMTDSEEILNWRALMFLKVYDGWPQPIGFRLRWSVFGFFWRHPLKTTITVGACTVGFIYNAFRTNAAVLRQLTDETSERDNLGLVIGDLNHYGGWYCHYCQAPANIVNLLQREGKNKVPDGTKNLDVVFIEDLIGGGVWIDGKTNLLRAYRSRESYFSPETVIANAFKYDWLVDNFYAKLDYY
ncbi:beta-1,4-mannosyl-glycoprotein 4-beta-N-acetylglucosaminyltransferase isoform X2 [Microplitis demolitor]|uniref:beta-1,4-mannosyl-glycoprotein 4-beta-N-acetylglucosaminyltransferase isoform X2 n=1 Tax=Microplitis demolitor TaxID=69319 RepID=UPI0004CDA81E|nr:beta-1,4-mannosyl-glycoprotein 4-beta-N-acetylglucosaminyltransferase isoform X2 [Microplitis demolitor]